MEIENIRKIFESIAATPSKLEKEEIIRQNKDNESFVEFLKFLYDDTITTGLSTKKINKKIIQTHHEFYIVVKDILLLMNFLTQNNTGTDNIILTVQDFLSHYDCEDEIFIKQVLTKSYKCGITSSTVNKAIPGLIEKFEVQLAFPYSKYEHKVIDSFTLTQKLDGHRTLAEYRDDGTITMRTRKGHQIIGLEDIELQLKKLMERASDYSITFDGEVIVSDKDIPAEDIFSATSRIIRKDGIKKGLTFHIFDIRYAKKSDREAVYSPYKIRKMNIENLFGDTLFDNLVYVPTLYSGKDKSKIPELMKLATVNKWEGLMLNIDSAIYENKRSQSLLKIKEFFSSDLLCTSVIEGTGKYENNLGAIVVDYKGNQVAVGSGLTDEQRAAIWSNPDSIVGKIVEVRYFEESKNVKNDGLSLRFPTFIQIREDKNEEDINYES